MLYHDTSITEEALKLLAKYKLGVRNNFSNTLTNYYLLNYKIKQNELSKL